MTRDPAGYGGGINLYSYAKNNPVMGSDPSGLAPGEYDGIVDEGSSVLSNRETSTAGFYSGRDPAAQQKGLDLASYLLKSFPASAIVLGGAAAATGCDYAARRHESTGQRGLDGVLAVAALIPGASAGEEGARAGVAGNGKNIALGLDKAHMAGRLGMFVKDVLKGDGEIYTQWQRGFADFDRAFESVAGNANNTLHVNLDGFTGANPAAAAHAAADLGRYGTDIGNYTNWEMHMIRENRSWWNRTVFYHKGQIIPNPFR